MNIKQRTVILTAAVIVAGMGLFPPWNGVMDLGSKGFISKPLGYALVFTPPEAQELTSWKDAGARIAFDRLIVQWLVVVVAAAGLVVILQDHRWRERKNPHRSIS